MRIIRSLLIVQTIEVVEDRPSRPVPPAGGARPVLDVEGEDVTPPPASEVRLRIAPVVDLPVHSALSRWIERPLRGVGR